MQSSTESGSAAVALDDFPQAVEELEIIAAFSEISDPRNNSGKRHQIALCLALFTLAMDGKQLHGSYQLEWNNPDSPPHPAIMLVSAYLVERGLRG